MSPPTYTFDGLSKAEADELLCELLIMASADRSWALEAVRKYKVAVSPAVQIELWHQGLPKRVPESPDKRQMDLDGRNKRRRVEKSELIRVSCLQGF